MTDAQNEAIQKIHDILREHFDAGLVIVESTDDDNVYERELGWHGGISTALGLSIVARRRLEKRIDEVL